jgi:O-antigen/teichoic acid export membrane protein
MSIFSSAFRLLVARLVGAAVGFVTQIVLARLLPMEDLGLYFAATSFAALAAIVATQGYPGVMQRFITRYRERQSRRLLVSFTRQIQIETVLITAVLSVAIAFIGFTWPKFIDDRMIVLLGLVLCLAAASSLTLYSGFAMVERRFELAQLPETLFRPILFLPIVIAMRDFAFPMTADTIMLAYALLTGALALFQFLAIVPGIDAADANRTRSIPQWRTEARLYALAILFATSFGDLVIVLASPFLGAADLAPFGIAVKVSLLVGFAVQVAHQVSLPNLAETNERKDASGLHRALLPAAVFPAIVTGGALVAVAVGGGHFLVLFGENYAAAKWPLFILVLGQLLRAVAGPNQSMLMLKGAQWANAVICIASTIALVISNVVLVPYLGPYGASVAVLIAVAVWVGFSAIVLSRRYRERVDLPYLLLSLRRRVT